MSGPTGGPGSGDDRQQPADPGAITEGAYGTDPGSDRSRGDSTRGGTTMTRPLDPYGQGGGNAGQSQDQQYHPPQAYPAPPGAPPPGNPPPGGLPANDPVGRSDQTAQLRAQPAGPPSGNPPPGGRYSAPEPPRHQQAVRRPRTGARTVPRTRKARLRVAKADPWSVMKVSFLLSIALGVCTVVAVAVLWLVMDSMGVFSSIGDTISEATETENDSGFDLESFVSLPRVLTFTGIIAAIDVVLATALATLGAFMYNLSAGFVGGVELTLAEDE